MNPRAIDQAQLRLARLVLAEEALCLAKTYEALESAWVDFLTAASTIYSKLEQGAKGFGPSEAWYGRKKNERRTDELLRYIHHARNSEEHGIDDVTQRWDEHRYLTPNGDVFGINVPHGEAITDLHFVGADGERIEMNGVINPLIKLVEVHDWRYRDSFAPPKTHLGENLPEVIDPAYIASLARQYLIAIIDEAKTLVPKS